MSRGSGWGYVKVGFARRGRTRPLMRRAVTAVGVLALLAVGPALAPAGAAPQASGPAPGPGAAGTPDGSAATTPRADEWVDGNSEFHLDQDGCFIGGPWQANRTGEFVSFRLNGASEPRVGEVFWARIYIQVFTNTCSSSVVVSTEVNLPAGTSFALGGEYPGYGIHCFYDDPGAGGWVEVTGDPAAGCAQAPTLGAYGQSLGWRTLPNGAAFQIWFPLMSTMPLHGMGDDTAKLQAYLYESSGWTYPFQWLVIQSNPPTIEYPVPSTTAITANTAHSVANLYNHHVPGNAFFDYGTTTGYGASDGPVAIGAEYNAVQVFDDWEGLLPNTTYHWRLRFVTAEGTLNGADQVFTTAAGTPEDNTPPQAGAPKAAFKVNTRLSATTVPVLISWPAAVEDSGSAVQYELGRRSKPGTTWGAWGTELSWTGQRSSVRMLDPAATYQFRDRARDATGNIGGFASGTAFRLRTVQENGAGVTFTGTWTRSRLTGAYGGRASSANVAGAGASFTLTGRAVALVAPQGPDLGKAEVWVDGAKAATIDLYSATVRTRRVVFVKGWGSSASHTVELRVLGTRNPASTGNAVWLDAFATMS